MDFYTVRDLRTIPKNIWDNLNEKGEVVITNNGKPTALMLNIEDCKLEEILAVVKQAQVMRAINNMRLNAVRNNVGNLSEEEIEQEIAEMRKEQKRC